MSLKLNKLHKWRRFTQFGFGIAFVNGYIGVFWTKMLYSGPLRQICAPILNCHSCPTATLACPIGLLQHYATLHQFPYFVLGFLGITGLVFGRAACGWLCPFGLFQDMMYKIKSKKYPIPKFFKYFKYAFLVGLVFLLPWLTDVHWFSRLCPWGGIIASIPWVLWNPEIPMVGIPTVPEGLVGGWFYLKLGIVALFMVLFVFTKRPFCYTACPLGAIYSFFNRFSILKLEVDEDCTQCTKCSDICELRLNAYEKANTPDCVECFECTACDNVKVKFDFTNSRPPLPDHGYPSCQLACPINTEAWRYTALLQQGNLDEAYKVITATNPLPSVCARVCHHPCESKCGAGVGETQPVALRALKRYITDNVDPGKLKKMRIVPDESKSEKIAVIGSGPAGLTAANDLADKGYSVTIFEAENKAGGMLISGIPEYRLPRETLKKEIDIILGDSVELKLNTKLGRDVTIESLFEDGFKAIFIAIGAHKSRNLGLENEDAKGVYPALKFLKDFNLHDKSTARGKVGIIGGGNSAIDSARVAVRQTDVQSVTLLYRRTENEMPAFAEEIEAAKEEGIKILTLVSPVKVNIENGKLKSVEFIKNILGEPDASGRRRPVPDPGSEFTVEMDTLISAIGEQPSSDTISKVDLKFYDDTKLRTDRQTMMTNIPVVFGGGDVVTGPHTVVDAMASGQKVAIMIDRYLKDEDLLAPIPKKLPTAFVKPADSKDGIIQDRVTPEVASVAVRTTSFNEVEKSLTYEQALQEASRCLRCDLKYTEEKDVGKKSG